MDEHSLSERSKGTPTLKFSNGKTYAVTHTITLRPRESVESAVERALAEGKAYEIDGSRL